MWGTSGEVHYEKATTKSAGSVVSDSGFDVQCWRATFPLSQPWDVSINDGILAESRHWTAFLELSKFQTSDLQVDDLSGNFSSQAFGILQFF